MITGQNAEILKRVQTSLHLAESYVKKYRVWDLKLLIISIVLGAVATTLAGGAAVGGKPMLDILGGWRILCSIVALLTLVGTICGTLHKTLQVTNRLASAVECVAKLRALELAITITKKDANEVVEAYSQILQQYPDCLT